MNAPDSFLFYELPDELSALLLIRSGKPQNNRNRNLHLRECRNQAFSNLIASRDSAEYVHEDDLHTLIHQNYAHSLLHNLAARSTTDIQEVRWLSAFEVNQVHGRHAHSRSVRYHAYVPVELDEVQALLLGYSLSLIDFGVVLELLQLWVPVKGVVVYVEPCIGCDYSSVSRNNKRVYLCKLCLIVNENTVEGLDYSRNLFVVLPGHVRFVEHLPYLVVPQSVSWINRNPRDSVRVLFGNLLDVHPSDAADNQSETFARPVNRETHVHLPVDFKLFLDVEFLHPMAFNDHPEHLLGEFVSLISAVCQLYTTSLSSPAHENLRLENDLSSELFCDFPDLFWIQGEFSSCCRNSVLPEYLLCLILVHPHGITLYRS